MVTEPLVGERKPTTYFAELYQREGVVQVPGVLTSAEVAEIREAFMAEAEGEKEWAEEVPNASPDDPLAAYPRFLHPHRHPDRAVGALARRLMTDDRLIAVATALMGPVLGAQSMFYYKPPGARGQALHQDNIFLQAYPETCLAAWIAIDSVDADNGGLMVVPGSHHTEIVCPESADLSESFTPDYVPVPEGLQAVQTKMAPGDVLFFNGSVIHGSKPNSSADRFRRSLIFHYIPESSTEVAAFYQPLIHPDNLAVSGIEIASGGGPCGEFGELAH